MTNLTKLNIDGKLLNESDLVSVYVAGKCYKLNTIVKMEVISTISKIVKKATLDRPLMESSVLREELLNDAMLNNTIFINTVISLSEEDATLKLPDRKELVLELIGGNKYKLSTV